MQVLLEDTLCKPRGGLDKHYASVAKAVASKPDGALGLKRSKFWLYEKYEAFKLFHPSIVG